VRPWQKGHKRGKWSPRGSRGGQLQYFEDLASICTLLSPATCPTLCNFPRKSYLLAPTIKSFGRAVRAFHIETPAARVSLSFSGVSRWSYCGLARSNQSADESSFSSKESHTTHHMSRWENSCGKPWLCVKVHSLTCCIGILFARLVHVVLTCPFPMLNTRFSKLVHENSMKIRQQQIATITK
jgi:hypothetical protein